MRTAVAVVVSLLIALGSVPAGAQSWPARPVKLIVPFPPGGSNDIMARLVGQKLGERLGQQFLVDNRAGASGIIGTDAAAKSAPDGYTVLMMSLTLAVNPSLYAKLPYDTEKDLVPVTLVASAPLMLVVHPSIPAQSVKELLAYAKANPDKLNFGSGGPGTTPHLAGEMVKAMGGVSMTHVPYKGGGPALADLVGGQIQVMLENIPSTLPHVKSGRLRALAVTSQKRSALVPDLPTLDEAGLKGFEVVGWNGFFVPAGTPKAVATKLHTETVKVLGLPDVKDRLAGLGADGIGSSPEEFAGFLRGELRKWAKIVKDAGIKVE